MTDSMRISGGATHLERSNGGTAQTRRNEFARSTPGDDDGEGGRQRHVHRHGDGPGARNPLVGAMLMALKGLMQMDSGNPAPTDATAAAAPAAEAAATDVGVAEAGVRPSGAGGTSRGELKEAAIAFTHELFSALRNSEDDGDDKKSWHRQHDNGLHLGHFRGKGHGSGAAYGDLAQRLRDLAANLDQAARPAAVDALAAPDVTTAGMTDAMTDEPLVSTAPEQFDDMPEEANPLAALAADESPDVAVSVSINIDVQFSGGLPLADAASGADQPAQTSPLLAAFEKLMDKLGAAGGDPAAGEPTPTDRLRQFLLGIADALKPGAAVNGAADLRPAAGSLIDTTA